MEGAQRGGEGGGGEGEGEGGGNHHLLELFSTMNREVN